MVFVVCEFYKFWIIVDVGYMFEFYGVLSVCNDFEFGFNFWFVRLVMVKFWFEGFVVMWLLVMDGKVWFSLFKWVSVVCEVRVDFFLLIYYDLVLDKLLESWDFDGVNSYFSDCFLGYLLFVL